MKIRPTAQDFKTWTKKIPKKGDLLFSKSGQESWLKELNAPVFTTDEIRQQSLELWTLNQRSWYAYSLNKAKACVWLPTGQQEACKKELQRRVARTQLELQVPTLVPRRVLSKILQKKLPVANKHSWITSQAWSLSSATQKVELLRAWHWQNEIFTYSTISLKGLPAHPKNTLKKSGLAPLLKTYASSSGPNCFGAAAAAISKKEHLRVSQLWLHWKPLERFLKISGYKQTTKAPVGGDILVFRRGSTPVHAALYLGEGLYFEKPGQDFYEPYRIERLENWRSEWKGCRLQVWSRPWSST